jgi:hypothetical protein
MNRIIKLAEDTVFKVSTEKTKTIMFSRRKFPIWAKGEKIEQIRQHRILRLTFDTTMNWLKHFGNTKARAEKTINIIKYLAHTTWGGDQGSLLKVHQMIVLGTLRYGEETYGSATEAVLKNIKPTHNRGIRLALNTFALSRTENVLCETGMTILTEMRKFSNTKSTIRVVTNKEDSIRPLCTNLPKIDENALRRAAEQLGTFKIDMRKIEITPQYNRPHGQQLITNNA